MTPRERILAALTWGEPDYIPWGVKPNHLPRGTIERRLRNMGMGLTIEFPVFRTKLDNVVIEQKIVGDYLYRTYRTPLGDLSEKIKINLPSEGGERSTQWKVEPLVKGPKDYEILEFIIENLSYQPQYREFVLVDAALGGDGITYTSIGYTPFMELMINYMGFRTLALELRRNLGKVERLLEILDEKKQEACKLAANSPAKIVLLGDNIDEVLVNPRLFRRYCLPYYQEYAEILHDKGKLVGSHMDGRLRLLKDLIADSYLDFIHGFTPPPGGNLTIREARKTWGRRIAIWVNIPEVVFYYSPPKLRDYIRSLIKEAAPGDGFMLGITETVPPERRSEGYIVITETVMKYGKYPVS